MTLSHIYYVIFYTEKEKTVSRISLVYILEFGINERIGMLFPTKTVQIKTAPWVGPRGRVQAERTVNHQKNGEKMSQDSQQSIKRDNSNYFTKPAATKK